MTKAEKPLAPDEIDILLAAFIDELAFAADPGPVLSAWQRRYPALDSELAFAAADRFAASELDDPDPATAAAVQSAAARLLAEPARGVAGNEASTAKAIGERDTLLAIASRAGWTVPALAARLRVPAALIERLSEGRVAVGSIPVQFVEALSEAVGFGYAQVAALVSPRMVRRAATAVGEQAAEYGATTPTFDDLLAVASEDDAAYWDAVLPWSARLTIGARADG